MSTRNDVAFPCAGVPENPAGAKLVGLHPQRQEGLWMQRVRVAGGVLSAEQWRTLARIAREFTPRTPLHLTTRQDVQIHDVKPEHVGDIQRALAKSNMTGVGAGGDTLRNIVVCPCSGLNRGSVDLLPSALQIQRTLEALDGIRSLPRKFKVSLSCSWSCGGTAWISDIGFVAEQRGPRWGFEVIVAGSLGAKPATGIPLFDWIDADETLPLAVAAVRVFAAHGDRKQRSTARLRHVRERLGDHAFTKLLNDAFYTARSEKSWPAPELPIVRDDFFVCLSLNFANGDVTPEAAEALADLADDAGLRVRINTHHQVLVFARDRDQGSQVLAAHETLVEAARPQPVVVACPGTRWCPRALVDTNRIADRLRLELAGKLDDYVMVGVSGCPNGCALSAVADIGLVGKLATREGAKVETFDFLSGGGLGRKAYIGRVYDQGLPFEDAVKAVKRAARHMGGVVFGGPSQDSPE